MVELLSECKSLLKGAYDVWRFRHGPPAFNGQRVRERIVTEILTRGQIKAVVETGTYLAATTRWFDRYANVPTHTVDAVPQYYYSSCIRFWFRRNVSTHRGDSRDLLRGLSRSQSFPRTNVLFYLDAHWYEDLPLHDELAIIASAFHDWVAVVDDCQVPDDPEYGYDDYGAGKRIDLTYLRSASLPATTIFWPAIPAAQETGAKRGCAVLGNGAAQDILKEIPLLRLAD
jgi:hypothetical protein